MRAIEPLIHALNEKALYYSLNDYTHYVRRKAAVALGELGDQRAIEPLIKSLIDENSEVRLAASEALATLGEPGWKQFVTGSDNDVHQLAQSGDARALQMLNIALDTGDITAAEALGNLGDARALQWLYNAMQKGNFAAVIALGHIGDSRAFDPLLKALGDTNRKVAAAEALGKLGDLRAVEPLINTMRDWSDDICISAAKALGKLGDPRAVEPLINALGGNYYNYQLKELKKPWKMRLFRLGESMPVTR